MSVLRRVFLPLCLFILLHFDNNTLQLMFDFLQGLQEKGWMQDALLVLHCALSVGRLRLLVDLSVLEH